MTLSELDTKITAILLREAGSSSWWTSAQIQAVVNELYRDLALQLELCKKLDETQSTVASTKNYTIPIPTGCERILRVDDILYDDKPLEPTSVFFLNRTWYQWRAATTGIPEYWYYEPGNENVTVSLHRTPSTAKVLSYELRVLPNELGASDSPLWPFTDGLILIDGSLSYLLAMAGGGRDLDRSDFYFGEMMTKIGNLTKHLQPSKIRRFKSIEETPIDRKISLGDHYPPYSFD